MKIISLFIAFVATPHISLADTPTATITASCLNLRTSPNTNLPAIECIDRQAHGQPTVVTLTGPEEDGFFPVQLADQRRGYMSREFLNVRPPVEAIRGTGPRTLQEQIIAIAEANTACLESGTRDRGRISNDASRASYLGLAQTFGRSLCRPSTDPARHMMVNGATGSWFANSRRPNDSIRIINGVNIVEDPEEQLVQVYQLVLAQAMRESNIRYWRGVDITNSSSQTNNTAEAGLCQTSYNAHMVTRAHVSAEAAVPCTGCLKIMRGWQLAITTKLVS